MQLQEFDKIIDGMALALETAQNLGQQIEEAKILYQMNEVLPDNMKLELNDLNDELMAKTIISLYKGKIKSKILEYREQLMLG